jgi:adenosylcobinamide-GDP ribazoletransferase
MKNSMYGLMLALQFLTRIPVPVECPWNKETSRWALRCYPVTGIILAGCLVLTAWLLHPFLPLWMSALLMLTLWVWLTGGLHLDGWMDVADAVGSNAPLEKKWEIMKDPRVGSFGILAVLFLLGWKAVFIYALLEVSHLHVFSFFLILSFSRFSAVFLMNFFPTAQQHGLAWEWKQNLNWLDVALAALPVVGVLIFLPGYLFLLPAYVVFFAWYGWWMKRNFAGSNGDLLGTAIEGGELWGLTVTWIFISFVTG